MKMKMGLKMGAMGLMILGLGGCALFGSDPTPPSKFEQAHYDIVTNVQPVIVIRTNTVQVTNTVVETVQVTNSQNQVVVLFETNQVPQIITVYNTNTVLHESYEYHANSNAAALTAGAAKLGELSGIPGVGTMVSIAGGALWGLWGTLRSSGRGKALGVLSQSLATAQQVIAKTPQGQRVNEELQAWLDQHHEVSGAAGIIDTFVDKYVDDPNARANAHAILALANTPKPTA